MRIRSLVLAGSFALALVRPSAAAVLVAVTDHFAVEVSMESAAPPGRAYRALVEEVGRWWHPDHTFSGSAANLAIEAVPGGCFCERFPEGGGARHLEVTFAKPGEVLRMVGALGPLQGGALAGTLTFTFKQRGSGSTVQASYLVSGFHTPSLDVWAPAVDQVLTLQVQRLVRYLATGSPEPAVEGQGLKENPGR